MRRILTAALLIPSVVSLILWAPPYLLFIAQLAFIGTALWEFFRLAEATGSTVLRLPGYTFAFAVALLSLADPMPAAIPAVVLLFLMILMMAAMLPGREVKAYLGSVSATLLGVLYVAVPLTLFVWVCLQSHGPFLALFTLAVIWTGDTAGFLVGRNFGKHKSSPRISPNKSWEGTGASLLMALLTAWVFARFFWGAENEWEPIFLAAALNGAGQLGDLAESALKRSAGVKDSSHLVPGHGGVLDRIDALLFAAPVLWYYWLWRLS